MSGAQVTPSFFGMLGVSPMVGRFFPSDAIEPGKDQLVILSEPFWRAQYRSDPGVIGQKLTIGEKPYVIVGVAPVAVGYLASQPELFVPLSWSSRGFDDLSRANTARAAAGCSPGCSRESLLLRPPRRYTPSIISLTITVPPATSVTWIHPATKASSPVSRTSRPPISETSSTCCSAAPSWCFSSAA